MSQNLIDKIWTAPLAGLSDSPFRMMNRLFGAKNLYSEMLSSEALWRKHKKTYKLLDIIKGDSPLIVQIFGSKAESFYAAVKEIEGLDYVSEININSGCPVRKIIRSGSGCALMKNPDLLKQIVASVRKATDKPISVKLRSGWDAKSVNLVDCSLIAQGEGADTVIIHPRTASQMFTGKADWKLIAEVKKNISIPVIGNGDLSNLSDADRMLKETGCDGVMVGRALIGNPWFFVSDGGKKLHDGYLDTMMKHIDFASSFYDESKAFKLMKKHLIYYLKGLELEGKKTYYDAISKARSLNEEISIVKEFLGRSK